MSTDQILLFILFFFVFVFLLWGRWRYDLVAFAALLIALILGLVPSDQAFSGFGHPATIIVALVLVVSRGLVNAGAIDLIIQKIVNPARSIRLHITTLGGIGAILSAFMNNVAALALLMPVDLQTAKKALRGPGITLMPLAFATILGGMATLIGTPPNIIIAQFRQDKIGEPFGMFDFTPVGLVTAIAGMIFVALVGWKLLPSRLRKEESNNQEFDLSGFIFELKVPENSKFIGKKVKDLEKDAEEHDIAIIGLSRNLRRLPGDPRFQTIEANDELILESGPESIDQFRSAMRLEYVGEQREGMSISGDMSLFEVVVPRDSNIDGRQAISIGLLRKFNVTLVGVSRQGQKFYDRVRRLPIRPGDILLLYGHAERMPEVISQLGCLPLAERGLDVTQNQKIWQAVAIFVGFIAASSIGLIYLPVALACVATLYVIFNIVPIRELYDQIEWPVVVLLGSMIPLGEALQNTGGY